MYEKEEKLMREAIAAMNRFVEAMRKSIEPLMEQLKKLELPEIENQPTIVKSGETWVAEYQGVDYLCMYPKTWEGVAKDIEGEVFIKRLENNMKGSYGSWKPISKIKITDDVAKLRPMVTQQIRERTRKGWCKKLYAVIGDRGIIKNVVHGAMPYSASIWNDFDIRLATVKDLTEGV